MPVAQLDGVGAKISERLAEADIGSVQRLATTTMETLGRIEGIGQKTAETLIEKAKAMAEQIEEEYNQRIEAEKAAAAEEPDEDAPMTAEDVFEEDSEFVTEADDVPEVEAPSLDEVEEDEEVKPE